MADLKKYTVPGFKAGAAMAGIKKSGRLDMALICSDVPATAAGVFTQNAVKAAPVLLDMVVAKKGRARAILANSGNANACTGELGLADALAMADLTGEALGVDTSDVFVASTGVIGNPMPMDRVAGGIAALPGTLRKDGWEDAARAIMTTDTFAKICGVTENIGGKKVTILGIAKGSGMINPNMATMLCFIATDAAIDCPALRAAVKAGADMSFNRITVDGDTSTNDSVIVLANGVAGNAVIKKSSPEYAAFEAALGKVMLRLAKMVAKDGEGATKLVEVRIECAKSAADGLKAARSVANSPLVKTAMFAADANWGRIICAAGYSGARMDPNAVEIWFDKVCMVRGGVGLGPSAEALATAVMKKDEYVLTVKLGAGKASASVYTTDLSYEYVKINAEYRS
ncbi:MAG: bifunctional glutamate N-acetyltransferase/amino-acid acetyltransferase ArgJ [Nitrospirae bacterium]|nr:bifunctional glutamate N-acetyltransferase/amino-acid acetyltransferase ArgJ [Nitrospirota bacterium]